jgi:hypothetical protein
MKILDFQKRVYEKVFYRGNVHENFGFPHRRIKICEYILHFYLKLITFAEKKGIKMKTSGLDVHKIT